MGNLWTSEELDFLKENYRPFNGAQDKKSFQTKLLKVSGNHRTWNAIEAMAFKQRVNGKEAVGLLTLTDMAAELGLTRHPLRRLAKLHPEKFPLEHKGKFTYVTEQAEKAYREHYRMPSARELSETISTDEAAEMLCVNRRSLNRWINFGIIQAAKVGPYYRPYLVSVKHAIALRQKHGKDWMAPFKDQLTEAYHEHCEQSKQVNRRKRRKAA